MGDLGPGKLTTRVIFRIQSEFEVQHIQILHLNHGKYEKRSICTIHTFMCIIQYFAEYNMYMWTHTVFNDVVVSQLVTKAEL